MDSGTRHRGRVLTAWALWVSSFLLAISDFEIRALWPSVVALGVVLLVRRVPTGLLAGGTAGVIILAGGNPIHGFVSFFSDHLIPALQDSWKIGAIIFTLLLGGLVALVEKGGGLQSLVSRFLGGRAGSGRRCELATVGMGLVVFCDGLANSIMVGRMMRGLADRCGVSRVRLAYLVDSTSSTVACLAFVSTWIATQLAMIREGYALAGRAGESEPYVLFFRSIPYNFYCLFTLFLVLVSVVRKFNLGAMREFEGRASKAHLEGGRETEVDFRNGKGSEDGAGFRGAHWTAAVAPIVCLIAVMIGGIYLSGVERPWPVSLSKIVESFGGGQVVDVLIAASALASMVAFALFPKSGGLPPASQVYMQGVQSLFLPVLILLGAWILSSTLTDLRAGEVISGLLRGRIPLFALPSTIFVVGALISFSTGSAWGTMSILMPLAVSVVFGFADQGMMDADHSLLATVVGAVFSGAVFGDHCSPISDTTIVASIACDVTTHDHVRTQLPYALLAAATAAIIGFIPSGLGAPPLFPLVFGAFILWFLPGFRIGRND